MNLFLCLIFSTLTLFTFINHAYAEEIISFPADTYLSEISSLEKTISGSHSIFLTVNKNPQKIVQKVVASECTLDIKTYGQFGLLFKDKYDLLSLHPHHKIIKYKGSYGIAFGVIPRLKARSYLYYDTKEARNQQFKLISRLAHLCHHRQVKNFLTMNESTGVAYRWSHPDNISLPTTNNWIALLKGELAFTERYHSLIRARHSIYLQALTFRGDEAGKTLADLMIKRKEQGIDVQVIIDGHSIKDKAQGRHVNKNTWRMLNNLMAAGVRVFGYACGNKILRNELRGLDFQSFVGRMHEKIWVVDGDQNSSSSQAIIGGMNIGQEYFRLVGPGKDHWRDQDLSIRGPLVKKAYQAFKRNMQALSIRYKSYAYDKLCFNPYNPTTEREEYLAFKNSHTQEYLPLDEKEARTASLVRNNIYNFTRGYIGESYPDGSPKISRPIYLPATSAYMLDNHPDEDDTYIYQAHLDMINNAKEEILIANAYFVPPGSLASALKAAAARGVKVKIITNSLERNDLPIISYVSRYHYIDLAKDTHGLHNPPFTPLHLRGPEELQIYEWMGKRCNGDFREEVGTEDGDNEDSENIEDNEDNDESSRDYYYNDLYNHERLSEEVINEITEGTMHSKYMVVDRKMGIVGSFNLDYSSHRNTEAAVAFEGQELGASLASYFYEDLELSNYITLEDMEYFKNPGRGKYKNRLKLALLAEKFL